MSSSKVAYIVSLAEGLEAFVYRELEYLDEAGQEFAIFAPKAKHGDKFSPKPGWPAYSPKLWVMALLVPFLFLKLLITKPSVVAHGRRYGSLVDVLFAAYFVPRMRAEGVTQIHCHFGDHKLFIGYYCHLLTGLPLTVTVHAHEFYTNPNEKLFPVALKACTRIFTIANKWKGLMEREHGIDPERIRVAHLFVNPDLYRPHERITVLAVGRFTERKGFGILMEAAKVLEADPVDFVFAGFGYLDLRQMASELGITDSVTVFDKLDQAQLRVLYRTVDIFCLPSITTPGEGAEGIPVVLMEAMASGLPVVATDCGATAELVSDILIEENSVEALVAGIRGLAADADLRSRQGAANRARVQADFSPSNPARFLEELKASAAKG